MKEIELKPAVEHLRTVLNDIEPEIEDVVDALLFQQESHPRWKYLKERRHKEAMQLRKNFLDTLGNLNYIINCCGLDLDIKKEYDVVK